MSSLFAASLSRFPRAVSRRRSWAEFFGGMIRSAREDKGLSIEQSAPRAGMTTARWEAMEEGQVPETREQLVAIAKALEADLDAIVALAVLCRQAWGR
jgi:transcriptional regulator with XRE-family HTH domain